MAITRKAKVTHPQDKSYEEMLQHVLSTLTTLQRHLARGDFAAAEAMLRNSPAGDCMGDDNYFVDFDPDDKTNGADVHDMILALKRKMVEDYQQPDGSWRIMNHITHTLDDAIATYFKMKDATSMPAYMYRARGREPPKTAK